jgi:hypothetical protein
VPELNDKAARLRPWMAPAFAFGLIATGASIALGLASARAPIVGVIVIALILSVPEWILPALRRRDRPHQ